MSLQSCSDVRPAIDVVILQSEGSSFSVKEICRKQSAYPTISKRYVLPENTSKGPTLDDAAKKEAELKKAEKGFEGNKSTGDSCIVVEQNDKVYPSESWKSGDTFDNIFMVQVRIENTSHHDETVYVTKAESEYQDAKGNWIPLEYTVIGYKSGYYNYSWSEPPYNMGFTKKDAEIAALRADIPIKGFPQADRMRRVHQSLPYPLHLRFKLTDNAGKSTKLSVVCYHEYTIESIVAQRSQKEKDNSTTFDLWTTCDDLDAIHRVWLAGAHDKKERYYTIYAPNTSTSLSDDSLYRHVYDSVKEKRTESLLDFNSTSDPWHFEVRVMVDLDNKCPYGLHVTGKTTTSSVEVYKMLPSEL